LNEMVEFKSTDFEEDASSFNYLFSSCKQFQLITSYLTLYISKVVT